MDTTQIQSILSEDNKAKHFFKGVFPRDQFCSLPPLAHLPNRAKQAHFVCNLDNSDQPGSHWIVVDFNKLNGKTFYFDPIGMPPIHEDLFRKLSLDSTLFTWNSTQFQQIASTVCGQYCVIYCLLKARNFSSPQIIDLLHGDGLISNDQRDHIVHKFIKSIYPVTLKHFDTAVHDINSIIST